MGDKVLEYEQKSFPIPAGRKNDRRFRYMKEITVYKLEDYIPSHMIRSFAAYYCDKDPPPQVVTQTLSKAVELHSAMRKIKHQGPERLLTRQGLYMCIQQLNIVLPTDVLEYYGIQQPPFYTPYYMDGMREALSTLKRISPFYVNGHSFTDYYPEVSVIVVDKAVLCSGVDPEKIVEGMDIQVLFADVSNIYCIVSSIIHRRYVEKSTNA